MLFHCRCCVSLVSQIMDTMLTVTASRTSSRSCRSMTRRIRDHSSSLSRAVPGFLLEVSSLSLLHWPSSKRPSTLLMTTCPVWWPAPTISSSRTTPASRSWRRNWSWPHPRDNSASIYLRLTIGVILLHTIVNMNNMSLYLSISEYYK